MTKLKIFIKFIKDIPSNIKKYYIKTINNFYIQIGGIDTEFELEGKKFVFAIISPSKYNLNYNLFKYFQHNPTFKKIFKGILLIPYAFTENFLGSFILSISIGWAVVGRELISVSLAGSFVLEIFFITYYLSYFLRLKGVYAFCIKSYGELFVKTYIGNPFTTAQVKLGTKAAIAGSVFLGVDQIDRARCSTDTQNQASKIYEMHVKNGSKLSKDDITNIWTVARSHNVPRVEVFSETIKNAFINKKP